MSDFIIFTKDQIKLELKNINIKVLSFDLVRLLHILYSDDTSNILQNIDLLTITCDALSYIIDNRLLSLDIIVNDIPLIYHFDITLTNPIKDMYFRKLNSLKNTDILAKLLPKYFIELWPIICNNYALHYELLVKYQINIVWLSITNGILYDTYCKNKVLINMFYSFVSDNNILVYIMNNVKNIDYINLLLKSTYFNMNIIEKFDWIDYMPVGREIEVFNIIYNHKRFRLKNLDNLYKLHGPLFEKWILTSHICKFMSSRRFSYYQMTKLCSDNFLVMVFHKDINLFCDIVEILFKRKLIDNKIINNLDLIHLMFINCVKLSNMKLYNLLWLLINLKISISNTNNLKEKLINYIVNNKIDHSLVMSDDEILDDDIIDINMNNNSDKYIELAYSLISLIEKDIKRVEVPDCNICYLNKVDCIISPCGHSICLLCSIKLNLCHICRKEIRDIIKFYL